MKYNDIYNINTSEYYDYFHFSLTCSKDSYIIGAKDISTLYGDIVIPREYNNLPVTQIKTKGFYNCKNIRSVFIPNTIKSINSYGAFEGCSNLSLVLFEKNSDLKSIGKATFKNCKELESIVIPPSVTNIEENAFECCTNLKEIYITSTVYLQPKKFKVCNRLSKLNIHLSNENFHEWKDYLQCFDSNIDVASLPDFIPTDLGFFTFELNEDEKSYTIYGKYPQREIKNLILPSYYNDMPITIIGENAFYNNIYMESLKLPEKLKIIKKQAFSNFHIKELEIPDSLETIEQMAFMDFMVNFNSPSVSLPGSTSQLEKVIISDKSKLSFIGRGAFSGHPRLKEFNFPKSLTYIGSWSFSGVGLESICIGKKVEYIGSQAFRFTTELKNFIVDPENTVYSNVDGVLCSNPDTNNNNFTAIESYPASREEDIYTIANYIRIIQGKYILSRCKNLRVLYINGNTIPRFFYDNVDLYTNLQSTKIYVSDEVLNEYKNSIQWEKYANIIYPQSIINDGIAKIDNTLIQWIDSKEDITIPKDIKRIGPYALGEDKKIKNIYVDLQNTSFKSQNGILFNRDKSELIRYPQTREEEEYKVPNLVRKLGIGSFIGGENLRRVTLGEKVEEIGEYAFGSCFNLTKINLENVKKIGKLAFYYCNLSGKINLKSIEILEENIFKRDEFYIREDGGLGVNYTMNISEVILGKNIKYIGKNALPMNPTIYIYALIPPIFIKSYYEFKKIYVPEESLDLYINSPDWQNYKKIIYPME